MCIFHSILKNKLNFTSVTFENLKNCSKPGKIASKLNASSSGSKYASKSKQVSKESYKENMCVINEH